MTKKRVPDEFPTNPGTTVTDYSNKKINGEKLIAEYREVHISKKDKYASVDDDDDDSDEAGGTTPPSGN